MTPHLIALLLASAAAQAPPTASPQAQADNAALAASLNWADEQDFDFARGEIFIGGAGRALTHQARNTNTKLVAQALGDLVLGQVGVAVVVHPAAGVGHHGPGAVVFQTALFPDHAAVDHRQAQPRRDPLSDQAVIAMALLVPPAVEADQGDGQVAVGVLHEGRSAVAAPQVVGRDVPELDAFAEAVAVQAARARRGHHGHGLVFADGVGDGDDIGLNGGQIPRAIDVDADRPLHQRSQVTLALHGHFIAR